MLGVLSAFESGSWRFLTSSPNTPLDAAPHTAVHLQHLSCFLVRIMN